MSTRLIYVIPHQYRKSKMTKAMFSAVEKEMERLINTAFDVIRQGNPQTATWSIPKWEEELKLPKLPDTTLTDVKRARILSRLGTPPVITPLEMARIAGQYTSLRRADLREYGREKRFEVIVEADGWIDHGNLAKEVKELRPKHLDYSVTARVSAGDVALSANSRNHDIDYQRANTFGANIVGSGHSYSGLISETVALSANAYVGFVDYAECGELECEPEEV